MSQRSHIADQFCAAARLVNEWRDTIFYAGTVALGAWQTTHGGNGVSTVLSLAYGRELLRAGCWNLSGHKEEQRFVGDREAPVNRRKYADSAFVGFIAVDIVNLVSIIATPGTFEYPMTTAILGCGLPHLYRRAGGIKGITESYQVMWDYPRKKGGGGTTQTQRFKDGFRDFGARVGRLLPRPAIGTAASSAKVVAKHQLTL